MNFKKFQNRFIYHFISAPFIYGMLIPFVFFDVCLELYHRVCFFCYDLPYVERGHYIKIDRHKLNYLNYTEKANCMYCGYANGLINYARVITAETEKYWCGIKHQADKNFVEPEHHTDFIEYGDKEAYDEIQPQSYPELGRQE
ncbi:MAG: hypothetical protein PHT69_13280 [Bacteroidales bacterium]|nr:hypothetical protein [Bacteroidales bacterium]